MKPKTGRASVDVREAVESFRRYLRAQGLPVTPQRLRIAEGILSVPEHLGADEILGHLRRGGVRIGRVTVYRTLKLLLEAKLVEQRSWRNDRMLYEPVLGRSHHDHLVCITCGSVEEFKSPRIEAEQARVSLRHGFHAIYHSHAIFGACRRCLPGGA